MEDWTVSILLPCYNGIVCGNWAWIYLIKYLISNQKLAVKAYNFINKSLQILSPYVNQLWNIFRPYITAMYILWLLSMIAAVACQKGKL